MEKSPSWKANTHILNVCSSL